MTPGIRIGKVGADEDMVTLRIRICDGVSSFTNEIHVGHRHLSDTVAALQAFKEQIHGGIFNLRFGEFGCEYASGALDARFHFRSRGKLLIGISAQSAFRDFAERRLASEARLYLVSEPALLDGFVAALRALSAGQAMEAELGAIDWL